MLLFVGYRLKSDKAAFDRRLRERIRNYILGYLLNHPCVDCGNSDVGILQFDHVRGKKKFSIGYSGLRSLDAIAEEIEKCDVRCANCHFRRHHGDRFKKLPPIGA